MRTIVRTSLAAVLAILAVAAASSCRSGKAPDGSFRSGEAYLSSLTAADTAALLAKADSCIALMVAGRMDEALANVGYVEDATLKHLAPEMAARTSATFKTLGVRSFERAGIDLVSSDENTVKYRLLIGPAASADSGPGPVVSTASTSTVTAASAAAPSVSFAFNAYRIDGRWYLSLKQ